MADYFPLIVDAANSTIDELPAGDNLNLANSGIVNAGNITAANFIGDGSQLTNLPIGTSLTNGESSVSIPTANGNINLSAGGGTNELVVTTTGVNVAGTMNVTGNITVGNISATTGIFTDVSGNGSGLSAITGANVLGPVLSATSATSATTAGTVTASAQSNITSVGTLTGLVMAGNITPNTTNTYTLGNATHRWNDLFLSGNTIYLGNSTISTDADILTLTSGGGGSFEVGGNATVTTIQNGNSNIAVTANGNISTSVAGNANITVITGTGINVAGTLNVSGNANVGNIGATRGVFTNVSGNGSSLSAITGANVTGTVANAAFATSAGSATTAGTVTTAAQPNITSVGTLSSLTATGNVTGGNLTTLGNVNATTIVDGGTGIYLSAGPAGYINFFTTGGDKASISDTGNITASNVIANSTVFAATANISGNVNAGNANLGNRATANFFTGTLTTAAQPNITSVGTLTGLGVNGNITASNITANTGVFTGNGSGLSAIAGANVTGAVAFATTANAVAGANVSGQVANALVAGTVYTAAQPNITSVGTLTSLTATGNVAGGNLTTGGVVAATGNVSGGNLTTGGVVAATGNVSGGNLTTTGVLSVTGTGVSSIAGNLDMTSNTIINLATPTNPTDAATKQYVDDIAQGLHTHDSCNAATNTTLAIISGGTVTYNNGTAGVGATLTTTGSYTTIDGVTLSNGMRILVKSESNAAHNGIYDRTSATVLTRSADFDTSTEMAGGDFSFVTAGTLYDNTGWVMTEPVITVGTTPVVWVQFSGAGTYTAGTGLTLNGSEFSITNTAVTASTYGNGDRVATFTVNAQGQLTNAANTVITANAANLTGSTLNSGVVTSSLTSVGTLGTLNVTGNANVGNIGAAAGIFTTVAGSLTTAAQPNITSVGTLASLTATGNVTAGNVYANTGTIGAQTLKGAGGNISNIQGANVSGAVAFATTANAVAGANVSGAVAFATTANAVAGANVSGTVANATFATSAGSATTAGTVTTAAQPNITSVGTLSSLTATGNVTGGNLNTAGSVVASTLTSNVATGTAPLTVTSTTRVNNLNVAYANVADFMNVTAPGTGTGYVIFANATSGNVAEWTTAGITSNLANNSITATTFVGALSGAATTAGSATTAGTVTTAAQPNITSVGTLTGLSLASNTTFQPQIVSTNFTNDAFGSYWNTRKSRANAIVQAGDDLGTFMFGGHDGNTYVNSAYLVAEVDGNPTANSGFVPSLLGFYTSNATSLSSKLNIYSNGLAAFSGVISGNGSSISAIAGANVSGAVAFATTANAVAGANVSGTVANATFATSAGTATTAGTVTTAAQPNITSIGTLSSLNVTGNATVGNLITGAGTGGNISGANVITANTFVGALSGAATSAGTAGTVTTAAQPNITSVGTLTGLGVNGTITGVNITANTGVFTGNANGLSSIVGANVTGAVAFATTANAVAGANVSGAVAFATTANAVAGANVSGTVANATFATSAGSATTAGTVTTAAQSNITSVGTLTSLGVSGNITAANITANTGVFTGNGSGLSAIAGANVTGTVANATFATSAGTAGTVTTNAQPNITSVGTLSALSVTGNVAAGNLTTTGVLSVTGTGVSSIAGNLDMTSNTIINLATPTNANDAATKQYVDDVAQGLHTHDSCNAATNTTLAIISGGTVTYNNGTAGVGATLTTTGTFTTIDGVTLANGMRILVKSESNAAHNGIYDRTSATVLTRSSDFDTPTEMPGGDFTFVTAGTLYDNTGWVMTEPVTTVGTTPVVWVQFSGAGTYTAGTGLVLNGSEFSVVASQSQITSVGTLTSLNSSGTITAPSFTANTGVFTGNANGLSSIVGANVTGAVAFATTANAVAGANVSGTVANATFATSAGSATTAGTVTTAAQPNITSVGTLTSLAVSGNITAGNANVTGQLISTVATGTAPFVVTSTTRVNNLNADLLGGLTTDTAGSNNSIVARTGNGQVIGNTLSSSIATGTAPLVVTSTTRVANLNVAYANVADNINVAAGTGNNFLIFANAATGNVSELTSTGLTANLSNNSITATTFVGALSGAATSATSATNASALLQNTSSATTVYPTFSTSSANGNSAAVFNTSISANLANASITATTFVGALSGAATSATTAGTVTTNAQPNITSVGSLTSLTVTGNANVGNLGTAQVLATANVTAPQLISNIATGTAPLSVQSTTVVANLNADLLDGFNTATANTASTVAVRDANGNVSANFFIGNGSQLTGIITSVSSLSNGNSNVNIPTANGNINLSAVGNANVLVVTGTGANITGTLNATGNLTTAGVLTVTGNTALSGANVSLGAVGNLKITGGTAGQVLQSSGAGGAVSWQTLPTTSIQEFTATAAQTTFTVPAYIVGSVLVFVNGIQMNSGDYTASTGTTVVLTEARNAGDIVRVISNLGPVGLNNIQNLSVAMSVALGM